MFWIITGIVLVALLVFAWLWDRKHGFDLSHRDAAKDNQARADGATTAFMSNGRSGGTL